MEEDKIIQTLIASKERFEHSGWFYCRIRWKEDGMEQDDVIALSNKVEDEYCVYYAESVDALIEEINNSTLDFDIISVYDRK